MYNSSIKVGPIKKRPAKQVATVSVLANTVNERLSMLKLNNFFEISGITNAKEVTNLRSLVSYYSKKKNIKFTTSYDKGVLTIQRVKDTKPSPVPAV